MNIPVTCDETATGWNLRTADASADLLAGPYEDFETAVDAAKELELEIINLPAPKTGPTVGQLMPGNLFRIDDFWYRLVSFEKQKAVVDRVCGPRESIGKRRHISELSVLSRKITVYDGA